MTDYLDDNLFEDQTLYKLYCNRIDLYEGIYLSKSKKSK